MAAEYVRLPAAAIPDLRKVLAWGLYAFAEVERVQKAVDHYRQYPQSLGNGLPEELLPSRGTCSEDGLTQFAGAFLWLDSAEEIVK